MHTVHFPGQPTNNYIAAALGIIFDTKKWDKDRVTPTQIYAIDEFFDSIFENMDLTNMTLRPYTVKYGDLLYLLDTDKRWVYTGSVTTPPCLTKVYWNVLRTI